MPNLFIEKSIEIAVPAIDVWQVFVDPELPRKAGGEYASEWESGSLIVRKDADGKTLSSGKILKIEAGKMLKHNVFKDVDGLQTLASVITYELRGRQDGKTTLLARESFAEAQDGKSFAEADKRWDEALARLKEIAETLKK